MTQRTAPPEDSGRRSPEVAAVANHDEIVAALNELLEAERAGTRVALASGKLAPDAPYGALMAAVRADEARWCAMLIRQLERFGATPSRRIGAFYAKAIAIDTPLERLAFLNRGQAWVVRRLDSLIGRVEDGLLRRELGEMLAAHRVNIDAAAAYLQDRSGPT